MQTECDFFFWPISHSTIHCFSLLNTVMVPVNFHLVNYFICSPGRLNCDWLNGFMPKKRKCCMFKYYWHPSHCYHTLYSCAKKWCHKFQGFSFRLWCLVSLIFVKWCLLFGKRNRFILSILPSIYDWLDWNKSLLVRDTQDETLRNVKIQNKIYSVLRQTTRTLPGQTTARS